MSYKEKSSLLSRSSSSSKPPLPSQTLPSSSSSSSSSPSGPVAILWDMENCPTPSSVLPEDVSSNIRSAIRSHPSLSSVSLFSAFGDFNGFPRRLREGCQRTGVKLVDVPNGRKDAADKAILVDMFLFALDNKPPCSIVLISGDVDFAPALHILGQRGYTIVLVVPSSVAVSTALCSAGQFVWDWAAMASGKGLVVPKSFNSRGSGAGTGTGSPPKGFNYRGIGIGSGSPPKNFGSRGTGIGSGSVTVPVPALPVLVPEVSRRFASRFSLDDDDERDEEETIVYRGSDKEEFCSRSVTYEGQFGNSSSMRAQSVQLELVEGPDREDQDKWWVRPGDFNGLKGQLVRLLELQGGTVPLVKVPSEYHRLYGRHLYMNEYGAVKLVHLFSKMSDAFIVIGKGKKKTICLRNTCDATNMKMCVRTPIILKRGEKIEEKVVCSSEESSEEERNQNGDEFEELIEGFKRELQELWVCVGYPIEFEGFEGLYLQKYKKRIEYCKFGVSGLEELVEKVPDVVELIVDDETKNKFLIPNFLAG
ncbi:hypothetical protein LUZ60_006473 [Juncus effusus]|nr:hypothetical protein LUZ60_006473 [Juncus effusus]